MGLGGVFSDPWCSLTFPFLHDLAAPLFHLLTQSLHHPVDVVVQHNGVAMGGDVCAAGRALPLALHPAFDAVLAERVGAV